MPGLDRRDEYWELVVHCSSRGRWKFTLQLTLMMSRLAPILLLPFAIVSVELALPLALAHQASRFSNTGNSIPASLLQQLEDAIAERNNDLQQRIALVKQFDELFQSATPEARSRLIEVQHEVRFLEALTNMRLNDLDLCDEQITHLLASIDAKQFRELDFRCRSLQAAIILVKGNEQKSLTVFEQLLSGDLSGISELHVDRACINHAVAFERNGMYEEAIERYQSVMLQAIKAKRDLSALQAGNNLLNLLLDLEDATVARQMLTALQPVLARNPQSTGAKSLQLFGLRLSIWEGETEASIKGLRAFIEQPVPPAPFLLGAAHRRLAEALQQQGKLEESIAHAEKAVERVAKLEPDVRYARLLLAELHLQNGDHQTAAELLKLIRDPQDLFVSSRVKYHQLKIESRLRLAGLEDEAVEFNETYKLLQQQARGPLSRISKNFELKLASLTNSLEKQRTDAMEQARYATSRAERYFNYSIVGIAAVLATGSCVALFWGWRRHAERIKFRQQQQLNAQLESLVTAKTLELKNNLEKQNEMARALEKKNRIETVGLLAGNIAHDINNLLQVIGNSNLLLADSSIDQELREQALAISNESLRHGTGVIRQILTYARPQESSLQLIRVDDYFRNSRAMFQSALWGRIQLSLEDNSHGASIRVDLAQLTTAMLNLLSNAFDAMQNGGDVHVRASCLKLTPSEIAHWQDIEPGNYVLLTVQDSGTGMKPEHLERAFEPFFTTKGVGEGTGLGLTSVHRFVKQSGGAVKLESSAQGTRVLLILPQVIATEIVDGPENTPREADPTDPLVDRRLLLVEDNEAVAGSLMLLLAGLKLKPTWSNSADDAVVRLQQDSSYDFVLSDLNMPGTMDGADLAAWITDNYPKIGVVLMSGYHDVPSDRIRVPFLRKPFVLNEVKELLNKVATGRKQVTS